MAETVKVAGEIESLATGNKVVDVANVKDKTKGDKSQFEINEDTYRKSETYSKAQVNQLVSPQHDYVIVETYADLANITEHPQGCVYRVSNYDGYNSQVDTTMFSEYGWDGSDYVLLDTKSQVGEVYDISEAHSGQCYEDLTAALGTNGANVPDGIKKGGMQVKFIQGTEPSVDNKYVQYFLKAQSFTTNESNWERMDLLEDVKLSESQLQMLFEPGNIDNYGKEKTNALVHRSTYIPCSENNVLDGYIYRVHTYDTNMIHLEVLGSTYSGRTRVQCTISTANVAYIRVIVFNERILEPMTLAGNNISPAPLKLTTYNTRMLSKIYEEGSIDGNGVEINNSSYARTVFLPCKTNSVLTSTATISTVFVYDDNLNVLDVITPGSTTTITITTQNAAFIRFVASKENVTYPFSIDGKNPYDLIQKKIDATISRIINVDSLAKKVDLEINKSYSAVFSPGGISSITGKDENNQYIHRSKFFDCQENGVIEGFVYRIYAYNEDFEYLGQEGSNYDGHTSVTHTVTTQNAKYIRLTVLNAEIEKPLFIEGYNSFDRVYVSNDDERFNEHLTDYNNPHQVTLEQLGGIGGVKLGSTPAGKQDGYSIIPNATLLASGLMSSEDKQKLDNIIPGGTINISGSGITKNASAYGFLPTNDGDTNATNLQSCLNGGGLVLVDIPGTYELSKTMLLDSNTELIFGAGVVVKLVTALQGQSARYAFLNRGALTGASNNNITIKGLNLDANGYTEGYDVDVWGQRGYIGLLGVKGIVLDNIHIVSDQQWYNIHIQEFEDIELSNIRIESTKDGLHFGVGKNFVIRDCFFVTEDDAIALNAVDYHNGSREYGWIENGLIENVHFGKAPNGEIGRGIHCLGGAWQNWQSGREYQTYGDIVANPNTGAVYVTDGTLVRPAQYLESTYEPNHLSGKVTYNDGLTWLRMDNASAITNSGVRNIVAKNLWYDGQNTPVTFNYENSEYCRTIFPDSVVPFFENFTFENIQMTENGGGYFFNARMPFRSVRFVNCEYKPTSHGVMVSKSDNETLTDAKNSILFIGTTWNFNSENSNRLLVDNIGRKIDLKIIGSIENDMSAGTPIVFGSANMDIVSDITLNEL